MKRFQEVGLPHRTEYVVVRGSRHVAKVALAHEVVFKAVWRTWIAKRVAGADDPAASPKEIAAALGREVMEIKAALRSLRKNGLLISTYSNTGWQGARAAYRPTEKGLMVYALAETLGQGNAVSVGRTAQAWLNRTDTEPFNVFDHAALRNGGVRRSTKNARRS